MSNIRAIALAITALTVAGCVSDRHVMEPAHTQPVLQADASAIIAALGSLGAGP